MRRPTNHPNKTAHPSLLQFSPSKISAKKKKNGISNVVIVAVATAVLIMMILSGVFIMTLSSPNKRSASASQAEVDTVLNMDPTPVENQSKQDHAHGVVSLLTTRFRQAFLAKYGSDAMTWFKKGVRPFGNIDVTAHRLLSTDKFVIAFAGYSVTVGRGNYFSQSFPFVLEKLLQPLLKELLSIDLEVRNAAIGGIPSFPYAFCTEHFLGADADVISWDYSMNEGNGAAIMESYIRLTQKALSKKQPMMIVLDKNSARRKLLEEYADLGILRDGLLMSRANEVLPKSVMESDEWSEFGAPAGCPGKSSWHPKRAEHEFLGYLLAMHFADVIDRALEIKHQGLSRQPQLPVPVFPKPLQTPAENPQAVTELLYGHDDGSGKLKLHDLSCRTSFLPAQDHEKVLPSVVVNGLVQSEKYNSIMLDRPDSLYAEGWVLDVSKIERDTKKKVEKCGGLGYIDMKIALYGIPQSGPLRLWLPYEGSLETIKSDTSATNWFDDLILCEANEKRDDKACRLDRDLDISVGGSAVSSPSMMNGAGVYLNRQTCLHVEIPNDAQVTALSDLKTSSGEPLSKAQKERLSSNPQAIGLVVDLKAGPSVTRSNGACCLSHIVWEQH